jgi:ssRNA-specific RNase YbeY (16S rRNA maturation enzyme)
MTNSDWFKFQSITIVLKFPIEKNHFRHNVYNICTYVYIYVGIQTFSICKVDPKNENLINCKKNSILLVAIKSILHISGYFGI